VSPPRLSDSPCTGAREEHRFMTFVKLKRGGEFSMSFTSPDCFPKNISA